MTLFRSLYRRNLPPVRPLQRDAEPPRSECSCAEEMPPRPQSPHHRMPPEVAWQCVAEASGNDLSWASAYRSSFLDAAHDPCGRPGPRITVTAAREGT